MKIFFSIFFCLIIFQISQARGERAYSYKFIVERDSNLDGDSLLSNNCTRKSELKVYLPIDLDFNSPLVEAKIKVKICTKLMEYKDAFFIVLPTSVVKDQLQVQAGEFDFSSPAMDEYFSAPKANHVSMRINTDSIDLVWTKDSETVAGPVLLFPEKTNPISVQGFNPALHLPIKEIQVSVPDPKITLRGKLSIVQEEIID